MKFGAWPCTRKLVHTASCTNTFDCHTCIMFAWSFNSHLIFFSSHSFLCPCSSSVTLPYISKPHPTVSFSRLPPSSYPFQSPDTTIFFLLLSGKPCSVLTPLWLHLSSSSYISLPTAPYFTQFPHGNIWYECLCLKNTFSFYFLCVKDHVF